MSKQPSRRSAAKRRPQARKGRTAVAAAAKGGRRDLTTWIIAGVIIAIGGAFLFAVASGKKDTTGGTGATTPPASLISKVTSVPPGVFTKVGSGTVTGLPTALPGPDLTKNGKPLVVYVGAEYCPYCATERWAMVAALSRFGTFKNLKQSTSSAVDVFPSTATLSFYKSTFTSKYLEFEPVEQYTNIQQGSSPSGYSALDKITSAQQALLTKFDVPPYVAQSSAGAIPFIDFGNRYLISGATYAPDVLQGKSADDIASALSDSNSDISKGAIGAANAMTAAICKLTKDQPANVCGDTAVKTIEAKLK